jgi:major type 1 subunit fimbrin (pilin)
MATTGTITFNGQVVTSSCTVKVNGNSEDASIILPTVSSQYLSQLGDTAGATRFTIGLSGCTVITGANPDVTTVKTRFSARNVDGTNLANTAGTTPATNVAIQLLEDTGVVGSTANTALDFTTGFADSTSKTWSEIIPDPDGTGDGTATFPFVVQYYANNDQVGAGKVTAIVDYEIIYQ